MCQYQALIWIQSVFTEDLFELLDHAKERYYFLARGDVCRLLMTFANSLDPDQDRQNVFFYGKNEKSQQTTTRALNSYPACMQHYIRASRCSFESHMIANYDFTHITPGRRQSKMLLTIDERRSKIDRNSILNCHLSR